MIEILGIEPPRHRPVTRAAVAEFLREVKTGSKNYESYAGWPLATSKLFMSIDVYEVRPTQQQAWSCSLSDALPFGRLKLTLFQSEAASSRSQDC
jgi:hypothetical protein